MKTFHLTVARVGENLFDEEALSATLPGRDGIFQVLAEHEPFVTELAPGEMHIKASDDRTYHFELPHGGVAEISGNQATILL
jgi:F0F1-type ATP synthase epsilon subunit